MQMNSNLGYRLAAMLGAGSVTAAILVGLALLAQPALPVADLAVEQASAPATAVATTDNGPAQRLRVKVVGNRRMQLSAVPVVETNEHCPVAAAHVTHVRSTQQPSARPDKA